MIETKKALGDLMTIKEDNFLYYVITNDNDTYSVHNRLTDKLILFDATDLEVGMFLTNNNPSHPFNNTYTAPSPYPESEGMTGLSYVQTNWDAYPWDTMPSISPSYEQMQFEFDNKEELPEKLKGMLREVLPEINDCEDDTD